MATLIIAVNHDVMQNPRLELLDKLILSYVINWEQRSKACFAKDGFFAGLFGVSQTEVTFSLVKLEVLGLIDQIYGTGGRLIKSITKEKVPGPEQEKDIFEL